MRSLSPSSLVVRITPFAALALLLACSGNDDSTPLGDTEVDGASSAAPDQNALGEAQKAELDGYIAEAIGRYRVPGAALAIVRGGDVVYEGAFGVRGVQDPAPVTADTRFALGSVTKSMTTLMMATLVDDEKLEWDARATDVLPAFALSSAASTAQIRVRDLLNGTTGVPRFDTPFFVRPFSPTELISFVQTIPLVAAPGEVFGYSNAVVAVGGYLGAMADGAAGDAGGLAAGYVRSMQQRVLAPIGMSSTTFDTDVALADVNHARPHAYSAAEDAVVEVPMEVERFIGSVLPAGGAWSTLRDLAAFASTELSGVAPNGTRVVSAQNLGEIHTTAISDIPRGEWPTPDREGAGYAMGWFSMPDYRGMRALSHDGNTLGFTSEVFLLPEADLAVVVLCNLAAANNFYGAIEQFAVETALSLEHQGDVLQSTADAEQVGGLKAIAAELVAVSPERAQPYLGAYEHGIRVDYTDRGLTVQTRFGAFPLAEYADSGLFVRTGELEARVVAGFDSDTSQLTLGAPGDDGLSQPFVVQRVGD